MQPSFRSDLLCAREEQRGVVYYRVDDPVTHASFRLYEMEYFIAQKLDGQRDLREVMAAVRAEHRFEVSEPDLVRFVGQLSSMGFVDGDVPATHPAIPAPAAALRPDHETEEMLLPGKAPSPALETLPPVTGKIDPAELTRLLKSAFLHVRQGFLVHARDYLLAARAMDDEDARLLALISSIEVLGENPSAAEVDGVWRQCQDMFPEQARDINPMLADTRSGTAARLTQAARRSVDAWNRDLRVRLGLSVLLVSLLVGGGVGLWLVVRRLHLFEGPVAVRVQLLRSGRIPVPFPGTAEAVRPVHDSWLTLGSPGRLEGPLPAVGTRVAAGEVLGVLALEAPQRAKLARASAKLKGVAQAHEAAAKRLAKLQEARQALQDRRSLAQAKVKALRPMSVLKVSPAGRRDLKQAKRALARINRQLMALGRRERGPRAAAVRAKKRLEAMQREVDDLHEALGGRSLRAAFAGEVVEVHSNPEQAVAADTPLVHLVDRTQVQLSFRAKDPGSLAVGGEAQVSIKNGAPLPARVAALKADAAGTETEIVLELADPSGALVDQSRDLFRLVREVVDPAYLIRPQALVHERNGHTRLWWLVRDHLESGEVELVSQEAGDAVVRDRGGRLRADLRVVTERADGRPLSTLAEETAVVVHQGASL